MTAAGGAYGGGWTCSSCGLWVQNGVYHVCTGRTAPPPTLYPYPLYQPVFAPSGWICPRCHVVHAPSVLRCECKATDGPKEGK